MSAPTAVERFCDVLETILLNGPIHVDAIEAQTGLERRMLRAYLRHMQDAGFIESIRHDEIAVGERLALILEHRRPSE